MCIQSTIKKYLIIRWGVNLVISVTIWYDFLDNLSWGKSMLRGKKIVLGVTGGIAAYKMATLASMLMKQGANVQVILTENGSKFITPHTFEALTHTRCMMDTFDRNYNYDVEHVEVAKNADLILVAPATANIIGKMAAGIADNMLLTTILAAKCKILVAPAMNTGMYENPIVQDNIKKLADYGMEIIEPVSGYLACGDTGQGKMVEPEDLLEYICNEISCEKDYLGKSVLITAGSTKEAIDPVRFISNHSTGKMGYSLAKIARRRGAKVTLVSGQTALVSPIGVDFIQVESAKDMYHAVIDRSKDMDIIIKAAAVADYTPITCADEKIKKKVDMINLELESTKDILKTLGENKVKDQILCGFAMESQNLIDNARTKMENKNLDLIVANSIKTEGSGFGGDTNIVTIISEEKEESLPLMSKEAVAMEILDRIIAIK